MRNNLSLACVLVLVSVAVCKVPEAQEAPAPPNFLNTIAVGDSLTAGFQNFSLQIEGQTASYAYWISRQVGTFMFLPLITEPGIPPEFVLLDPGPPPVVVPRSEEQGTRLFPSIIAQNLAIPGQTVGDALTNRPDLPIDSLEDAILGVPILVLDVGVPPLTQIELAVASRPTFTIFWLGNQDVLGSLLDADPSLITPLEDFQAAYEEAVGAIISTGSGMIIGNIPDATVAPLLTPAELVAEFAGAPLETIGPILGLETGDSVTSLGLSLVDLILNGLVPGPLPDNVVLTREEVETLRSLTDQMNAFIESTAAGLNVPVVDIHALLQDYKENGVVVEETLLTTEFLGGIFTLDGLHPTHVGYALIANAFIDRLNEFYGLSIPQVDVASVLAEDPLFNQLSGMPQAATTPVMRATGNQYRRLQTLFGAPESNLQSVGEVPEGP